MTLNDLKESINVSKRDSSLSGEGNAVSDSVIPANWWPLWARPTAPKGLDASEGKITRPEAHLGGVEGD